VIGTKLGNGTRVGGFTVLAALTSPLAVSPSNPDIPLFGAGTSNYGISSLPLLASDSHKFESKYMEGLLGGTIEEKRDVYVDRSPVEHAERIKTPLLVRTVSSIISTSSFQTAGLVIDSSRFGRSCRPTESSSSNSREIEIA
jgi:hypothetical protein